MIHILIIEPSKPPREADIHADLKSMQDIVGGMIQAVYPFEEPVALICNEEAKLLGLPLNRALWDENGNMYDIIAGTFFLCAAPKDKDSFESLTEEQVKRYIDRFRSAEVFLPGGIVLRLDMP